MHLSRLARLLWPYVAMWLVLAATLGAYAWYEIEASRDRELLSGRVEAENLARVLSEQAGRSVESFVRTLGLIKIVHESTGGATQLTTLAESLRTTGASEIERRVVRYDAQGRLADASDAEVQHVRISVADLPWFAAARERRDGRVVIGQPARGRVSGQMAVPFAVRLNTAEGEFDGVLSTGLDPARLVQLFRQIRIGERSSVGLMDSGGLLYAWSSSSDPSEAQPNDKPQRLGDVVDPAGIVARAPVPGTDLVAFAALSEDRMLADQRRYARSMLALALLTLGALTLLIALVGRRAVREASRRGRLERGIAVERAQARTDPLTGVGNRRAFEDLIALCHAQLERVRQPFALAIVDVDRFKGLNDSLGHATGDQALRRIAHTLGGCIRRSDLVARLGGDEFAVLMPDADARAMRRPFNSMFTALTVAAAGEGWPISFSVGVIAFESPLDDPMEAIVLADKLMYAVKESGRNGVRFAVYRDGCLRPYATVGTADEDLRV